MFFYMVILDSNNPYIYIYIYICMYICFQSLINELKSLWSSMTLTYDVLRKQNFQVKVALLWTINDFPVYVMVSGWSTHGN